MAANPTAEFATRQKYSSHYITLRIDVKRLTTIPAKKKTGENFLPPHALVSWGNWFSRPASYIRSDQELNGSEIEAVPMLNERRRSTISAVNAAIFFCAVPCAEPWFSTVGLVKL